MSVFPYVQWSKSTSSQVRSEQTENALDSSRSDVPCVMWGCAVISRTAVSSYSENLQTNQNGIPQSGLCKETASILKTTFFWRGRGFDTRWGEFLNLPNPSGSTRP
jgi:hypothetical protein